MEVIDTYIVRVYRRDLQEPQCLAGLVEIVGTGEKRSFAGDRQLLELLRQASTIKAKGRGGRR